MRSKMYQRTLYSRSVNCQLFEVSRHSLFDSKLSSTHLLSLRQRVQYNFDSQLELQLISPSNYRFIYNLFYIVKIKGYLVTHPCMPASVMGPETISDKERGGKIDFFKNGSLSAIIGGTAAQLAIFLL